MRYLLSDEQWERIEPLLPKARGRVGRPYLVGHRTTLEAIPWLARTGAPCRRLVWDVTDDSPRAHRCTCGTEPAG